MDANQRRVVSLASYAIAIILFVFNFGNPFWQWMTWDNEKGTLDLGFVKVTSRPAFPNDGKAVGLGLILPIVLAAAGSVVGKPKSS